MKQGLPKYRMSGVGEGNDSEGSDWIIKTLEEKDKRPLWISVWGGVNDYGRTVRRDTASFSDNKVTDKGSP